MGQQPSPVPCYFVALTLFYSAPELNRSVSVDSVSNQHQEITNGLSSENICCLDCQIYRQRLSAADTKAELSVCLVVLQASHTEARI